MKIEQDLLSVRKSLYIKKRFFYTWSVVDFVFELAETNFLESNDHSKRRRCSYQDADRLRLQRKKSSRALHLSQTSIVFTRGGGGVISTQIREGIKLKNNCCI